MPTGDQNSCYTSLSPTIAASAQRFKSILPTSCGGSTTDRTVVAVGENVLVQNGADTSFLMALQSCVASGVHDYILAVTQCGNCTGSAQIIDFVTLHIADASQVVATGPAANKGIHGATQVCNNNVPAGGGHSAGGLYGSRGVAMVQ